MHEEACVALNVASERPPAKMRCLFRRCMYVIMHYFHAYNCDMRATQALGTVAAVTVGCGTMRRHMQKHRSATHTDANSQPRPCPAAMALHDHMKMCLPSRSHARQ